MSDLTVYAEALIATVARAFYDDEAICIIDVLIRDKFLRDDDMAPRLSLPAKKLRATLQFLQEEHLVKSETVDDLNEGGSQTTKFWYIDYNHAVHSIRLRIHFLKQQISEAERSARSNSYYLCPGYEVKRCNGRYTEQEAQQMVDPISGCFVCQECYMRYQADPNAPPLETYTLTLVDNAKDLHRAMDHIRRVNVQLSGKMIGGQQIRASIYDLLQKVRGKGRSPITSNLPSENFALGIGSKRLAGTGRTANQKAKKLEQEGVAASAMAARNYLVGGGRRSAEGSDLTFLKNAMGNEIAFSVEKGGGARANLLASGRRRRQKLMDAAATRVGATVPLELQMKQREKERLEKEEQKRKAQEGGEDGANGKNGDNVVKTSKGVPSNIPLAFLNNNIGRQDLDEQMERLRREDMEDAEMEDADHDLHQESSIILSSETEDMPHLWQEDTRKASFQTLYEKEMRRQRDILSIKNEAASPPKMSMTAMDMDDRYISWEDG